MLTPAIPEGETAPDVFFLRMRNVAWDGTAVVTLTAAWDGHGTAATQSHALRFAGFPATRIAWPGHVPHLMEGAGGHNQCLFTAVIVGIVETALEAARQQVARQCEALRAYERVEWTKAEQEGWLIQQAYKGIMKPLVLATSRTSCPTLHRGQRNFRLRQPERHLHIAVHVDSRG